MKKIVNSFEGNSIKDNGILVKNAKNGVNNDGLTEQLVERDYKILVELVRKADSSSYSISVASSDIASLCLGSDCCRIKGYLDKRIKSNSDLKSIMEYKIGACLLYTSPSPRD